MPVLQQLLKHLNTLLLRVDGVLLAIIVVVHFVSSWMFMVWAGESEIAAADTFWYFYMVTATTVGYGDYSPSTAAGRAVVSFWIMTGGISLFAAAIGKATQFIIAFWRKDMQGLGDHSDLENHIVILGWHGDKTLSMINQLKGDTHSDIQEIVLCSKQLEENPAQHLVHFVRGESLTSQDMLNRAGINTAERIIIFAESDDQTLAAGLAVSAQKPKAHIVTHFNAVDPAELFKAHCPEAECTVSVSTELIARSAQDPGSSRIQTQLLSTLSGPTQFCVQAPSDFKGCDYGKLFYTFKETYNATVFGVATAITGDNLKMNPDNTASVAAGVYIYFMAPDRLAANDIDWAALANS